MGASRDILITPLYGELSFAEQERAIRPADRRKVVLATNIAETSLTIEGVKVVVDSGYCRRPRYNPATGLDRLVTERVTAAAAVQRAGRAGRLGPGICYRLWSEHIQRTLLPHDPPEIAAADLTSLALILANWGVKDANELPWLDPPPGATMSEGRNLLKLLGALDANGLITRHGKEMARLPVHPRLAHLLLKGRELGSGPLACDVAALLSERDIFRADPGRAGTEAADSDLAPRLESLAAWRKNARDLAPSGIVDQSACKVVDRTARQFRQLLLGEASARNIAGDALQAGVMAAWAYPDRIALERESGTGRYLLANGRGARLSRRSNVFKEPLIVAVSVAGTVESEDSIHLAVSLGHETLREEFGDRIVWERDVRWDERQGRLVGAKLERYGCLVLREKTISPTRAEASAVMLSLLSSERGLDYLSWSDDVEAFISRVRFIARIEPEGAWPNFERKQLAATAPTWLGASLAEVRTAADLRKIDLLPLLRSGLSWEQKRRLDAEAPTHILVPSGSRIRLNYPAEGPPVLAVKLQELFGLADTPRVGSDKVPVLLHLLSPALRPIQVTQDLRRFWDVGYNQVKRELKGRYPRHPWPDDPWNAVPTRHAKPR